MTKITRGAAFLICAILGIAVLIGAVCNFAYSLYSSEPVEAAEISASRSAHGNPDNSSYKTVYWYIYVYVDDTYIQSCSVSYPTFNSDYTSNYGARASAYFDWSGSLTLTPKIGNVWRSTSSLTARLGSSLQQSSLSTARTAAYNASASGSSYTFTRSGNTFTYNTGWQEQGFRGSTTGTTYNVWVFKITTSSSNFYYEVKANTSGSGSGGSVSTSSINYTINASTESSITYTSSNSSYFTTITIDGIAVPIEGSAPSSFTSITPCQYKCYRNNNNKVVVVIKSLTKGFTITGTFATITATISSGSSSTATVATTTANGYPQWRYTFDAKTNYYINTLNVGGTAVNDIPLTDPGTFTSNGNCDFKCYRNNNQVIVIINVLKNNTNVTGTYATLWSVTSNKSSLTISEQDTTQTREHYFSSFSAQIVANFTNDQNFTMYIDGIKTTFKGSYCTGSVAVSNGTINYTYSKEGNSLTISLENITIGPHSVQLDYELGLEYNVNASIQSPGQGTVDVYIDDEGLYNILVTPVAGSYVYAMIFNDVSVVIDYYKAEVYGVAAAETVTYVAKDSTNIFLLKFDRIYGDTNVVFSLINSKPNYRIPPSSSGGSVGVSGTVVTAELGGEARMVGFDYNATDNESIHFVAVAYSGYNFAGWQVDGEILEGYNSVADIPYTLVKDKVVTAVFEPKETNSSANDNLNDPTHGADIL